MPNRNINVVTRQLWRLVRQNQKPSLYTAMISNGSSATISDPPTRIGSKIPMEYDTHSYATVLAHTKPATSPPAATVEDLIFYPKGHASSYLKKNHSKADVNKAFEEAIQALNSLQSNDNAIRNSIQNTRINTKEDTIRYLERSGLPLTTVEKLSFIHVAGTKGKGSTCALAESLLRHHGAHTGFFSSPHIMHTNERIRIDGQPMDKEKFTKLFWKVYNRLKEQSEHETDMPAYFKFLTILCFHAFVEEQVDVAILEVGIGGEQDTTNIVRNVRTVGITSLGLEHTELLGNTLQKIAWQKAGIIKPNSHVYTHVTQPECLQVIRDRASDNQATVHEVPRMEDYFHYNLQDKYLDSFHNTILLNGSLAIQLVYDWLDQTEGPLHRAHKPNETKMCPEVLMGLRNTHWPGRCQLVEFHNMRLHFDGAHTPESMKICTDWFQTSTSHNSNPKILIFNRTGDTDPIEMLQILQNACRFDLACFVPNLATTNPNRPSQVMVRYSGEYQITRAHAIAKTWQKLSEASKQTNTVLVHVSLWDAFLDIRERYGIETNLDILITGSIHLLGAAISALDQLHGANNDRPSNGHK
ncbi:uncharacterized protein Dwil_GK25512 [Drosophila willistoni]|uniref:Folylpolyglutamate synthase n=1 Tax=Drosophila willistoni TaxID=7260 RepID=B4NDU2_DROWI|nr:folylpolyglutamate synthase, mitochondrial [Drosophila willistoni]EDW81911.1 uncharacterized protein Dwil_GK25512 [Drosophila willistoni]